MSNVICLCQGIKHFDEWQSSGIQPNRRGSRKQVIVPWQWLRYFCMFEILSVTMFLEKKSEKNLIFEVHASSRKAGIAVVASVASATAAAAAAASHLEHRTSSTLHFCLHPWTPAWPQFMIDESGKSRPLPRLTVGAFEVAYNPCICVRTHTRTMDGGGRVKHRLGASVGRRVYDRHRHRCLCCGIRRPGAARGSESNPLTRRVAMSALRNKSVGVGGLNDASRERHAI